MKTRNVKEFGAAGDGTTLDTAAIQAAIDAGGMVYCPPGVYLSGTLYLRSNGGLELSPGAILRGSPDLADYNPADFVPQNSASKAAIRLLGTASAPSHSRTQGSISRQGTGGKDW